MFDEFLKHVERGEQGLNRGLPMGLPKFGKEIDELQPATIYLLGGETGTGKTAFLDQCFVLEPILHILENLDEKLTIKVFYESMEIDRIRKIGKWTSYLIHRREGIITSMRELLSKGDNKIPPEIKKLLPKYQPDIDKLFEFVEFHDGKENPTGIYKKVKDYMERNGQWKTIKVKNKDGTFRDEKMYFPNNPNEIVLQVTDHLGILRRERGYVKKENIDKKSEYNIELRNKYYVSSIDVSQFNRSLADIDRQRFKEIQPQLDDFKDSGNPAEDANIVIALFNPHRYNLATYADYKTMDMDNRYRSATILKSRDGEDMLRFSLNFLGECGRFRHLPRADQMTPAEYKAAREFTEFKYGF